MKFVAKPLKYALPPEGAAELLRAPRLSHAALVVDGDEMRPALVMRGDMAIVLTWKQCLALAETLKDWSRLVAIHQSGKAPDKPLKSLIGLSHD